MVIRSVSHRVKLSLLAILNKFLIIIILISSSSSSSGGGGGGGDTL
jgi:hypothetical protein